MSDTQTPSPWKGIIARLDGLLLFLLRLGLVCGLLSLGYLLYAFFSGGLFQLEDPRRFSPPRQMQLIQTLITAGWFCSISFLTAIVCSLLRAPDDQDVLTLVVVGGLLIGLGFPWVVGYQAHQSRWGHNEATQFLVHQFGLTGILIGGCLGVLLLQRSNE